MNHADACGFVLADHLPARWFLQGTGVQRSLSGLIEGIESFGNGPIPRCVESKSLNKCTSGGSSAMSQLILVTGDIDSRSKCSRG